MIIISVSIYVNDNVRKCPTSLYTSKRYHIVLIRGWVKKMEEIEMEKVELRVDYSQFSNMGGFRRLSILFVKNANVEDLITRGESLVNGIHGVYKITPIDPEAPAVIVLREHWSIAQGDWSSNDGDVIFTYVYHPSSGWK